MRVITGKAKGTQLTALNGAGVRPTLDRVKECLFDRLGHNLAGETFLDLFAGSGGLGVEALSRGADRVVFVENDPKAQRVILANLAKCKFLQGEGASQSWELLKTDALGAVSLLEKRGVRFDLVHVDPPYDADLYEGVLLRLADSAVIDDASTVIVEHFHKKVLNPSYGRLSLSSEKKLGNTLLSFYSL